MEKGKKVKLELVTAIYELSPGKLLRGKGGLHLNMSFV